MDRSDPHAHESPLELFGLPASAQSVWRGLLAHPNAELRELSRITKLSASETGAAIAALIEAGLVHESLVPAGVTAIDPALVLETYIARAEREMTERAEQIAGLRTLIPDFANEYALGRITDGSLPGVDIVVAADDIRHRIDLASETATTDTRSIYHGTTLEGVQRGLHADLDMIARGVRCRSIVGPNELDDPDLYAVLGVEHSYGESFRALPEVPSRLLIFDQKVAVLQVDPADIRFGAVFVRMPTVITSLTWLFDHLWSIADPIFMSSSDPQAPTGRLARTLELIAIGNTDERIARTLGVAVRTIARDVSQLKVALGVKSRAEIPAAAIRRGWL
jgi:DNA-binding CsgD family transcriptional regulator